MSTLLPCLGLVGSSASVSTLLAWFWAKKRGWFGYLNSTVAVWLGVAALLLFMTSWNSAETAIDLPHFLSNAIFLAPLTLLPAVFLVALVAHKGLAREIIIASIVASILALPLSIYAGIYAACYVGHDCL